MSPPKLPFPRAAPHRGSTASNAILQQAFGLHRQGQLDQAELLYRKILQSQPQHFDTLQLLASLHKQRQDFASALALLDQALKIKPAHAAAHNNRGNVLRSLKRPLEALASYTRALQLAPDEADIENNRGNALSDLSRLAEAIDSYDRVLQLRPEHVEAHYNRGNALGQLNRPSEALASYEQALQLNPRHAECHTNHGNTLDKLKRLPETLSSYQRALQLQPEHAQHHTNLGNVLYRLERPAEALASYARALQLQPDVAEHHANLGNGYDKLRRYPEALASYERALQLEPEHAPHYYNCGIALSGLRRLPAALASYERALQLQPDYTDAQHNCGTAWLDLNQPQQALLCYEQAIQLLPEFADAHFNASLCHLLLGQFEAGWRQHEWRWQRAGHLDLTKNFTQTLWLGQESLAHKTILLHCEQGAGDTIQFCRYAKQVAALGASVILAVPAALKPLLRQIEGVSLILSDGEALPRFDYFCPLMSLPLAFQTDLASISGLPYLRSDPAKTAAWQAQLGAGPQAKIGLVWSGNMIHTRDQQRSIALAEWHVIFQQPAHFYCLQQEVRPADRAVLLASPAITFCGHALHDFSDTAALVAALDLVITVDTSVAHLAGALGKEVWILLPFAPDWRWLQERRDSPWYDCARLFRQSSPDDWRGVLAEVALALQQRLQTVASGQA